MMENSKSNKIVKINYSSVDELLLLHKIGKKRAESIIQRRKQIGAFLSIEDLEAIPGFSANLVDSLIPQLDWSFNGYFVEPPKYIESDAKHIADKLSNKVDLILTSPPYWRKRDYGHSEQLGQEETPQSYILSLCETIDSWISLLHSHSSVFINIGDTYQNYSLIGIPILLEAELRRRGWLIVNRIIWAKSNGVPEPLQYRLAGRFEFILHLARSDKYYSDAHILAEYLGINANPGDVWQIPHSRNTSEHLAPFPDELVRRIIHFAAPEHVCKTCNKPFHRIVMPTFDLDMTRPQAKRALELFEKAGLNENHLHAIRAVGISDAGKAKKTQQGANGNSNKTRILAQKAKEALGGYFREFTFSKKVQAGWTKCNCKLNTRPGIILDPFTGSGTTVKVANEMGRTAIGSDLILYSTPDNKIDHINF